MNVIREYQVKTTGHSQGLKKAIPTGFRVVVTQCNIISNEASADHTHTLECQVATYKDGKYDEPIANDNVPTRFTKGIDVADLADDPKTLVEDNFRVDVLDAAYTADNVAIIV